MLTPQDHEQVAAAIREAETRTDGEISVVVAPESDSYADAVLHWALLIALLPLALFASFPDLLHRATAAIHEPWADAAPPLRLITLFLLVATVIAFLIGWLIFRIPAIRLKLTPHATRVRRCRRRAIMIFQVGTERRTATRTGVLLYLSLAEHHAEIVADESIQSRIGGEEWGEAMAALLDGIKAGQPGQGIAAAVARIGDVLATHFPFSGTDPNEMPDRLIQL
jgi:putative membrane protein